MNFFNRAFPFLNWFKDYSTSTLRADLISGITVALVLIPQSMAYAQLAGLPAYYGLYAAFLPPMIASLFGSSNQLATGPVAVVSLMTAATLEPLATSGSTEYILYAIILALLVGLFQLTLGLLRLGLIVNFLSHPVVNGFTNAAALIIATSQLSKIFGVYVDKADHHYETIYRVIVAAIHYTHWPTLGMAALAFVIMFGLKKFKPKAPNVLVAVVVTILLSWLVGFQEKKGVELSQIESQTTRELIQEFNLNLAQRKDLECKRTDANKATTLMSEEISDNKTCQACHSLRHPSFSQTLTLRHHQVVELQNQLISQKKKKISEIRGKLRQLLFEATKSSDQKLKFYVKGELPEGVEKEGNIWRINIKNKPLDEKALAMSGGGAVVSTVPAGLPDFFIPFVDYQFDWGITFKLFFMAMVISLLGFMEAISIAKAMAARTKQRLDPNQELIGQGLANIIGSLGQSYAVSGSFSRSAVNLQAGAITGLSNVFSSGMVTIVLLFFTPLLYHLPQAVLAAIIIMAVIGLLNVTGFVHAWNVQKFDGITGLVTFIATLIFAPHLEYGIFIGVVLSLGAYLFRTMKPHLAELSLHPDGSLRDAERHHLPRCKHIAAIRFDGPLNFANVSYLEDEIINVVSEMPELRHVFFAAHGLNEIDASGEEALSHLVDRLRQSGYSISFSGLKEKVQDAIQRTHLYQKIGPENFYPTQLLGISSIYAKTHIGSEEYDCPLSPMQPHVAELALHPDGSLRDAKMHKLQTCRHIAALRFDSPLNLATSHYLEDKIKERVLNMPELKHVFIAAHGINEIDNYGLQTLREITSWLRTQGHQVSFSGFKDNVLEKIEDSLIVETIGAENIFPTQLKTIDTIHQGLHENSDEKRCPLVEVVPLEGS
jgi:MFS superfamily sulfate permease-like transporter